MTTLPQLRNELQRLLDQYINDISINLYRQTAENYNIYYDDKNQLEKIIKKLESDVKRNRAKKNNEISKKRKLFENAFSANNRHIETVNKKRRINENQQEYDEFGQNFNVDDVNEVRPIVRQKDPKSFQTNTAIRYAYLNESQNTGQRSYSLISHCFPAIKKSVNEMKNIKVVFNVEVIFTKIIEGEIELIPIYHVIPAYDIDNVGEIKEMLSGVKTQMKDWISEYEGRGSNLIFRELKSFEVTIANNQKFKTGSYIEIPKWMKDKKCCINIKNDDNQCVKYCILYHIHKDEITHDPQRVSIYKKYENDFDWSGIKFPCSLKEIRKIEELVGYGINIFGYDDTIRLHPLQTSSKKTDKIINLLFLESDDDKKIDHCVYIKDLNVAATPYRNTPDGKYACRKSYVCVNCCNIFSSQQVLDKHRLNGCNKFEPTKTVLPKKIKVGENYENPVIKFKNHSRKFEAPVVIYGDFETHNEKYEGPLPDGSKSTTTKLAELTPCSYGFNVVSKYPQLNLGYFSFRGENAHQRFLTDILKVRDQITKVLKHEEKMIITPDQQLEFDNCNICHICNEVIHESKDKHRDHDHINGLYRGCAHAGCNINFNDKNFKVPVYFHNLKGFDGHLIIQALAERNFSRINVIAQNFEKYMSFTAGGLKFLDSFAFLSSSLDKLSSALLRDGIHNFKNTLSINSHYTKEQIDLILKKGVYPYDYMDSFEKFEETTYPTIDKFYSNLSEDGISRKDYIFGKKVWNAFNIQNLGEYHDLYLKTDVLLLTDVFENFRETSKTKYQLDPANGYYTLPNYAFDAMLLKTGIELEQLTDPDMYLFCEMGIRGGVSMASQRFAQANNPYMKTYDESKTISYIEYLDANNLYGHSMIQKLPYKGFKWVYDAFTWNANDIINYDSEGDTGCIIECDIEYPEHLHDEHNSYPLAPESRVVLKSELSPYQKFQLESHNEKHDEKNKKLIPNLYNKEKYICHIKNLQYYIKKGLIVTKIHRILEFKQSEWLKPYIDFNTNQRKLSTNDFEKDLYKLMNNAVFGKTMENVRNHVNIGLYTDEKLAKRQFRKPQYQNCKIYSKDLIAIQLSKGEVELNKPVYVGLCVLDLSKLHMYQFHYDYIKNRYGEKANLLFTDTDSLVYHIETEDLYRDNREYSHLFDFSNYNEKYEFDRPKITFNEESQQLHFQPVVNLYRTCDKTNEKEIGIFKDEMGGKIIREVIAIGSKCNSILMDNNDEKQTCKGIKESYKKRYLKHENYKNCLFGSQSRQRASFNNLRSHDHHIGLYRFTKTSLSCSNNKAYLLEDGITSYSYGHKNIPKVA